MVSSTILCCICIENVLYCGAYLYQHIFAPRCRSICKPAIEGDNLAILCLQGRKQMTTAMPTTRHRIDAFAARCGRISVPPPADAPPTMLLMPAQPAETATMTTSQWKLWPSRQKLWCAFMPPSSLKTNFPASVMLERGRLRLTVSYKSLSSCTLCNFFTNIRQA